MKCMKAWVAGLLLVAAGWSAQAAVIEFSPRQQTRLLGEDATVDVIVSNTGGALVGTYDFFVDFDTSILSLADVVFGTGLGGLDALNDIVISAGRVNVSEVSLLSDLSGLQSGDDPFVLFTLVFQTRAVGTSALDFSENILGFAGGFLGDDVGDELAVSRSDAGSITVINPGQGNGVPEPASAGLVMLAALAAFGARRRPANPR